MVTTADLPDYHALRGQQLPFLYCPHCQGEWSADRADYGFREAPDHIFTCDDCDTPLQLVTRQVSFRPWKG